MNIKILMKNNEFQPFHTFEFQDNTSVVRTWTIIFKKNGKLVSKISLPDFWLT